MRLAPLALILAAVPGTALAGHVVPLVPVGIPFSPATPEPVAPGHPLYHRVAVSEVSGMPKRVGGSFTLSTRPAEFNQALRDTLAQLNMLAPSDAEAKVRLATSWGGLDIPFHIGSSSRAVARLTYTLTRIDDGRAIFSREIATKAESSGGDAVDREQENGRLALMTNLASMALCIDRAAYGEAPADCALTPNAEYRARRPTTPMIIRVPRR